MARARRGRAVNGILMLDKPVGLSSNQLLQRLRWIYQAQKAGHGGTLDPFASGALPILFGEASKFSRYYLQGRKSYLVTARFGAETETDDIEGAVTLEKAVPDLEKINWAEVLGDFHGTIQQTPPIYSALKVNGKRAYELARQGEAPELAAREVIIHAIRVTAIRPHANEVDFQVDCGTGTYIRALVRDLARVLGSAAHAVALRRLSVGGRDLPLQSLEPLLNLREAGELAALDGLLLPVEMCVEDLPKAAVPAHKVIYIRHGNDIETDLDMGEYALYDDGQFFGVGESRGGRLYPQRLCRLETAKA